MDELEIKLRWKRNRANNNKHKTGKALNHNKYPAVECGVDQF